MDRTIRRLPDGELAVTQALWACGGPASAAELEERPAGPPTPWRPPRC